MKNWPGSRLRADPEQSWIGQLNEIIYCAVFDFDQTRISNLAVRLWKTYLATTGG